MAKTKCICKCCKRPASEISEYINDAKENGYNDIDEYVMNYEGTYNHNTGYFYCTECYIKLGMPLGKA